MASFEILSRLCVHFSSCASLLMNLNLGFVSHQKKRSTSLSSTWECVQTSWFTLNFDSQRFYLLAPYIPPTSHTFLGGYDELTRLNLWNNAFMLSPKFGGRLIPYFSVAIQYQFVNRCFSSLIPWNQLLMLQLHLNERVKFSRLIVFTNINNVYLLLTLTAIHESSCIHICCHLRTVIDISSEALGLRCEKFVIIISIDSTSTRNSIDQKILASRSFVRQNKTSLFSEEGGESWVRPSSDLVGIVSWACNIHSLISLFWKPKTVEFHLPKLKGLPLVLHSSRLVARFRSILYRLPSHVGTKMVYSFFFECIQRRCQLCYSCVVCPLIPSSIYFGRAPVVAPGVTSIFCIIYKKYNENVTRIILYRFCLLRSMEWTQLRRVFNLVLSWSLTEV